MKQKIFLTILFSIILNFSFAQLKRQFICSCFSSDGGDPIFIQEFEAKFTNNEKLENTWDLKLNGQTIYGLNLCVTDKGLIDKLELTISNSNDSIIFFANNLNFGYYKYGNPFEFNSFRILIKTSGTYKISLKLSDKIKKDEFDALLILTFINKNK